MKKVAAIILAAGSAKRFGGNKTDVLLLNGKRLIQHILDIVIGSELEPIIIVTGLSNNITLPSISGRQIQKVVNTHSHLGISSSIQTGIHSIPEDCDGCMVVLGDQPFISIELINTLLNEYSVSSAAVLYPTVNGKRTNPVILDRVTFSAIDDLSGDVGAREIFNRFESQAVEWHDHRLLLDLDTLDDYAIIQKSWYSKHDNSDPIH